MEAVTVFAFSGLVIHGSTDRKWMGIMDAYLMDPPADDFTVFTPALGMTTSPLSHPC